MIATPPRSLIFESGVGGLSVLAEVHRHLPWCEFVYACDNRAFPYGTKPEADLVNRVEQVLKALIANTAPDIVVIACNTASTVALPHIRAHFSNPVVGVVPAIKPAAALSRSGTIGLLATPGTIERAYTQQLIDDFASHCSLVRIGSARLVEIAEAKLRRQPIDRAELTDILAPFFANHALDTVVLACTHFPLLLEEFTAIAPRPLTWIDSGEAIARRVASFTGTRDSCHTPALTFNCWLTTDNDTTTALRNGLRHFGATTIANLDI